MVCFMCGVMQKQGHFASLVKKYFHRSVANSFAICSLIFEILSFLGRIECIA